MSREAVVVLVLLVGMSEVVPFRYTFIFLEEPRAYQRCLALFP